MSTVFNVRVVVHRTDTQSTLVVWDSTHTAERAQEVTTELAKIARELHADFDRRGFYRPVDPRDARIAELEKETRELRAAIAIYRGVSTERRDPDYIENQITRQYGAPKS